MCSPSANRRRLRVLMVGPGQGVLGGIRALVETFVPLLEREVELVYLPTVTRRRLRDSGTVSPRNIAIVLSQYLRFLFCLASFRPQVVHVHTSHGIAWLKDTFFLLAAKTCGCRVVLHIHSGYFDELNATRRSLFRCYARQVLLQADAVITVSTEWGRRLERTVAGCRVYSLLNCVAVETVKATPRSRTGRARALFLGSVGPSKGVFDLLEAMRQLRSKGCRLHLSIAGDEEREGDLRRARAMVAEFGLSETCELVGPVRGKAKARLLEESTVFVLPSYNEGLPVALIEALSAGLAVVATPVGGIPEVVLDGHNGFLVPCRDAGALAGRLALLADDQRLRDLFGLRSREIAEQLLDVRPYVRRLTDLYELLADGNSGPSLVRTPRANSGSRGR
jgi:glycosyltransferase involved in cell wall biosynthesis